MAYLVPDVPARIRMLMLREVYLAKEAKYDAAFSTLHSDRLQESRDKTAWNPTMDSVPKPTTLSGSQFLVLSLCKESPRWFYFQIWLEYYMTILIMWHLCYYSHWGRSNSLCIRWISLFCDPFFSGIVFVHVCYPTIIEQDIPVNSWTTTNILWFSHIIAFTLIFYSIWRLAALAPILDYV